MGGIAAAKQYGQCAGISKAKTGGHRVGSHRDSGHLLNVQDPQYVSLGD